MHDLRQVPVVVGPPEDGPRDHVAAKEKPAALAAMGTSPELLVKHILRDIRQS